MKAGILGGGQLGRMLLQAAINYPVETYVLENDSKCPSAHLCHHFKQGDIKDFETVYAFGKELDVLTIEIESVNIEALEQLEKEGVKVIPNSHAIKIIRNKILQKEFYKNQSIPTPSFVITQDASQLLQHLNMLPAVHKAAMGGYDGKGVQVLRSASEISQGFNEPSILEKLVDIKQEVAVMVAVAGSGEIAIYPSCEMVFDPVLNILDFQVCPARLSDKILWKAEAVAMKVVKDLRSPGIFAVEMFVDHEDNVWVNETAPRVHNSGHHTIEANYCSQFDMLWRIMLNYPLGNTELRISSAVVNLIGAKGHSGKVAYAGINEIMKLDNIFVHIYGKEHTKPGRKMGHVTIVSNERQELIHQAMKVKNMLTVQSQD